METRQCADCKWFDIDRVTNEGISECEKKREQVFATDITAEVCRDFSTARYDTYKRERAKVDAKRYKEENRSYSSTGCYITTAVVEIMGLSDDCSLLMTIRKLRNEIMQNDPQYKDLLMKYDALGPIVAMALRRDENKMAVAQDIMIELERARELIESENFETAIALYSDMTHALIRKYITTYAIGEKAQANYDQNAGGHGAFKMTKVTKGK